MTEIKLMESDYLKRKFESYKPEVVDIDTEVQLKTRSEEVRTYLTAALINFYKTETFTEEQQKRLNNVLNLSSIIKMFKFKSKNKDGEKNFEFEPYKMIEYLAMASFYVLNYPVFFVQDTHVKLVTNEKPGGHTVPKMHRSFSDMELSDAFIVAMKPFGMDDFYDEILTKKISDVVKTFNYNTRSVYNDWLKSNDINENDINIAKLAYKFENNVIIHEHKPIVFKHPFLKNMSKYPIKLNYLEYSKEVKKDAETVYNTLVSAYGEKVANSYVLAYAQIFGAPKSRMARLITLFGNPQTGKNLITDVGIKPYLKYGKVPIKVDFSPNIDGCNLLIKNDASKESMEKIRKSEILKELSGGEDVDIERKYRELETITARTSTLVLTNSLPVILFNKLEGTDESDEQAVLERSLFIATKEKIKKTEAKKVVKIISDEKLVSAFVSYILNWSAINDIDDKDTYFIEEYTEHIFENRIQFGTNTSMQLCKILIDIFDLENARYSNRTSKTLKESVFLEQFRDFYEKGNEKEKEIVFFKFKKENDDLFKVFKKTINYLIERGLLREESANSIGEINDPTYKAGTNIKSKMKSAINGKEKNAELSAVYDSLPDIKDVFEKVGINWLFKNTGKKPDKPIISNNDTDVNIEDSKEKNEDEKTFSELIDEKIKEKNDEFMDSFDETTEKAKAKYSTTTIEEIELLPIHKYEVKVPEEDVAHARTDRFIIFTHGEKLKAGTQDTPGQNEFSILNSITQAIDNHMPIITNDIKATIDYIEKSGFKVNSKIADGKVQWASVEENGMRADIIDIAKFNTNHSEAWTMLDMIATMNEYDERDEFGTPNDKYAKFIPKSAGQYVQDGLKTALIKRDGWEQYKNVLEHKLEENESKAVRLAMKAGAVVGQYVPAKTYVREEITEIDLNSAYAEPFTQKAIPLPYGAPEVIENFDPWSLDSNTYRKAFYVIQVDSAEIEFLEKTKEDKIILKSFKEMYSDTINTKIAFDSMTWEHILKGRVNWDDMATVTAYKYKVSHKVYAGVFDKIFNDKLAAKNEIQKEVAKTKITNIYGSFGRANSYTDEGERVGFKNYGPIAEFILSYGRLKMYKAIKTVGADDLVLAKTDALHFRTHGKGMNDRRLKNIRTHQTLIGAWKIEGVYLEGYYKNAGQYVEVNKGDGSLVTKSAGIAKSSFEGVRKIEQAKEIIDAHEQDLTGLPDGILDLKSGGLS